MPTRVVYFGGVAGWPVGCACRVYEGRFWCRRERKGKGARSFFLVKFWTAPFQGKAKKPWSTDNV